LTEITSCARHTKPEAAENVRRVKNLIMNTAPVFYLLTPLTRRAANLQIYPQRYSVYISTLERMMIYPVKTPALLRWLYPNAIWHRSRAEKSIFLTFDDGPVPDVTPEILNILKTYGVKATF